MASHGEPHNRKDALDPISQSEWEKDPFNLNSCLKLQDIRLEGVGSRARVFSVTYHHHDSPGDVLKNAKPRVCLKIITASFGDTAEHNLEVLRKNVLGVIKVWRNLEHPNINPIYGWTLDPTSNDSHFCFVSQFCPNYNVSRYLRKHPDADREKIVCEVAKGLRYLHDEANIVHGDVKPNNVLISDEGIAMLSDFGQAEILDRAPQNLQDAGRFLTIEYWPPEVFSTEDADYPLQRSKSGDVWAFGCTLLEILFGKAPYYGVHRHLIIVALLKGKPPFQEIDTTTIFGDVAQRCLPFDADERVSIAEVVARLGPSEGSVPLSTTIKQAPVSWADWAWTIPAAISGWFRR